MILHAYSMTASKFAPDLYFTKCDAIVDNHNKNHHDDGDG